MHTRISFQIVLYYKQKEVKLLDTCLDDLQNQYMLIQQLYLQRTHFYLRFTFLFQRTLHLPPFHNFVPAKECGEGRAMRCPLKL